MREVGPETDRAHSTAQFDPLHMVVVPEHVHLFHDGAGLFVGERSYSASEDSLSPRLCPPMDSHRNLIYEVRRWTGWYRHVRLHFGPLVMARRILNCQRVKVELVVTGYYTSNEGTPNHRHYFCYTYVSEGGQRMKRMRGCRLIAAATSFCERLAEEHS